MIKDPILMAAIDTYSAEALHMRLKVSYSLDSGPITDFRLCMNCLNP